MKVKQDFILRHMADMWVVVPVGESSLARRGVLNLNETGAFLWEKLEQDITKEELLAAMLDEFEVEEAEAAADIDEFIGILQDLDVLENLL